MRAVARRCVSLAIVGGLCLILSGEANAQFGGGNNNNTGGTGGTGTGGTGTGSTFGGTGTGGAGAGGSLGGVAGQLAAPQLMTVGQSIDATGGTGFAGRGNASENFVGGVFQPGQGQGGFSTFGQGNANQFAAINRQGQGQFNRRTQQTGPSRSERIRPRHRIAFSVTPVQTETIRATLQTRLTALPTPISGIEVTLDAQGTATLQGTAPSEADAKLAAALARLEPGVMKVDNQLVLAGDQ